MSIHFTCPHCQCETIVEEQYLGKSGPCFACGKTIEVPYQPGGTAATRVGTLAVRSQPATLSSTWLVVGLLLLAGIVAAMGTMAIIFVVVRPAFLSAQAANHKSICGDNLKKIGAALQQYHALHQSFPPAYIADDKGKPMHSWRVLILPHLGHSALHSQYNFSEPWDGPNNSKLAARMPSVFACPANSDHLSSNETGYMVLVGPATPFPPNKSTKLTDIKRATSQTILVVESNKLGVCWMDPQDIDLSTTKWNVNDPDNKGLGSNHPNGLHVLMADGTTVKFMDEDDRQDTWETNSRIRDDDE